MSHETADYAIPFTDHDAVIEAGALDPEWGEPESWPEWTDESRWEPTEADSQWAAQNLELPPARAHG